MSCPICATDYYPMFQSTVGTTECEFITDSGKKCSKKALTGSDICKLHESNRLPIKCLSCEKDCCKICYRKFFLALSEEPHCIHCKKNFDLEFLLGIQKSTEFPELQRFSKTFIWGPWKTHREQILLEQIMVRLPEYQPIAASELKLKNYSDALKKLRKVRQELRDSTEKGKTKKLREIAQEIRPLNELYYREYRILHRLNDSLDRGNEHSGEDQEKKEKEFITRGKCPKEGCNGFIEDQWKCGMCETAVCSHCMCVNIPDHKCSEEDIKTTKLIRESTKPCPGCRTRIQRSQGCNQMFCTYCHIFFDWSTGKQIKKTVWVHNPEHVEWMRKNGLNKIEVPEIATRCINYNDIFLLKLEKKYENKLLEILRKAFHEVERLENYRSSLERNNRKSSIDYLKGLITKEKLAILVQRHFKADKKQELINLRAHTMYDTIFQILRVMISDISKIVDERSIIDKITDKIPVSNFFKQSLYIDKKVEIVENTFKMISNLELITAENIEKIKDLF